MAGRAGEWERAKLAGEHTGFEERTGNCESVGQQTVAAMMMHVPDGAVTAAATATAAGAAPAPIAGWGGSSDVGTGFLLHGSQVADSYCKTTN